MSNSDIENKISFIVSYTNKYQNNNKVTVTKCKRPSFKSHRGRTWDSSSIFIDNREIKVYLDTTWGQYIYFQYGKNLEWYKIKMWSDHLLDLKNKGWDINPFEKTSLTTKLN
jgi:hypothetical protein